MFNSLKDGRVCEMHSSIRDSTNYYFVLSFCPGGDLDSYLKLYNKMDIDEVKFYAA